MQSKFALNMICISILLIYNMNHRGISMKRILVLLMLTMMICSSAFAECKLDMNRWKHLATTDNCACYFDTVSLDVNNDNSSFEVWECMYYPGNYSKCTHPLCLEKGLQSIEHYHYLLSEYNYKHRTCTSKRLMVRDGSGNGLYSYDWPSHLQKAEKLVPDSYVEYFMVKIKEYIDNPTASDLGAKEEPLFPVVINNAKKGDVQKHIYQTMKTGLSYPDTAISEDSEKVSLIFGSKKSGKVSEFCISFSAKQQGKDVLLNGGAFTTTRFPDGKVIGPTKELDWDKKLYKMALNIKALSTGRYSFGLVRKDHPEGDLIAEITPGSPFERKGIKVGDILISINGYQVKDYRSEIYTKKILDPFSPDARDFVIKHNGETKQYTIKPKFISPEELQKRDKQYN